MSITYWPKFFLQIEIGILSPDEDIDPSHHASLEEEEEEEVEHVEHEERRTVEEREDKELPIIPQFIPTGSGESGTLMGPSAQGGLYYTWTNAHTTNCHDQPANHFIMLSFHLTGNLIG